MLSFFFTKCKLSKKRKKFLFFQKSLRMFAPHFKVNIQYKSKQDFPIQCYSIVATLISSPGEIDQQLYIYCLFYFYLFCLLYCLIFTVKSFFVLFVREVIRRQFVGITRVIRQNVDKSTPTPKLLLLIMDLNLFVSRICKPKLSEIQQFNYKNEFKIQSFFFYY